MTYISLYILIGFILAFLDRKYIKENASDLTIEHCLRIKTYSKESCIRYFILGLALLEVLVWPYVFLNIVILYIRKIIDDYKQKRKPKDSFYRDGME